MFIDTHCHLNIMVAKEVDAPLQPTDFPIIQAHVAQAAQAGVTTIINVGTSLPESHNSMMIAACCPNVYATVGIHPCDATASWRDDMVQLESWVKEKGKNKIVGIGETGLDYYHKPFDGALQKEVFSAHIELANRYDLPLVVHVREAGDDLLKVLEQYKGRARGVIHCFQQSLAFAQTVIEWGFYIGIDAPITYPKNGPFREIVAQIPLSSIVLETDAPFLPPQEYRGRPNHPAYLPGFAQTVADLHGVTREELAASSSNNARRLFGVN